MVIRDEINAKGKRSSPSSSLDTEEDKLHLILPFNGKDHHIELSPYHDFISPEMVIETRGVGVGTNITEGLRFKRATDEQCHYRGFIRGHPNSRAALSLCDGVAGYVKINDGRYFIEPLDNLLPGSHGQHVHMIYKRDATHEENEMIKTCGTGDDWETAWAEQLAKREHRLMENDNLSTLKRGSEGNVSTGTHSIHHYIELALVADQKFLEFWIGTDYELYLLTIMNIMCDPGDKDCSTAGLGNIAAACDPAKAVAICVDRGLISGVIITHELGHVLGCHHDQGGNGCPSKDLDGTVFIMAPSLKTYTLRWSPCSRLLMTKFLNSPLGDCLINDPTNRSTNYQYPNMLPGAMYDSDFQCYMVYPTSVTCDSSGFVNCKKLWCRVGMQQCVTRDKPPADGTRCGPNKRCVQMGSRPSAINGGWGIWRPSGVCSRTCGGGVHITERECDNPRPSNGGRYCLGERRRVDICNVQPCDPSRPSFRASQCSEHDFQNTLGDGLRHTWHPIIKDGYNPCMLQCINEYNQFYQLGLAEDGTPCKSGTNNICFSGRCRKVGCDWVLDSGAIEDRCHICQGDGTQCTVIEGDYNETRGYGYAKVVTIPKSAKGIKVFERGPSENSLAVKLEHYDDYCLNGDLLIYKRPESKQEEIEIKGPIRDDIQIQYCKGSPPKQIKQCKGTKPCRPTCHQKPKPSINRTDNSSPVNKRMCGDNKYVIEVETYEIKITPEASTARGESELTSSEAQMESTTIKVGLESGTTDAELTVTSMKESQQGENIVTEEGSTEMNSLSTLKPGTLIKDEYPADETVLIEAPIKDDSSRANLSDIAFQENGDSPRVQIDTSHEKIYRGPEARKRINEMAYGNFTDITDLPDGEATGQDIVEE
ncbi:hypothetical protein PV328_002191 [Microctonus aethiopoides]|uniref:Peptidase M12B domain-containing protein n=1 Tax=Microctonus aethiopoides TaxID=144406 RepID=A0AA39FZV1_9HYME|nr:hypothetical protein PV328_002191 [Microctonus aethiopoides]